MDPHLNRPLARAQAEHRERHRWSRRKPGTIPAGPIKLRERTEQIADIEHLMAATEATVERVMANVAKIVKPGAASA